eukprot:2933495-Alexandrium_andersonii.AAC.1
MAASSDGAAATAQAAGVAAPTIGRRKFLVNAQPRRRAVASCRSCRQPFEVGELRYTPYSKEELRWGL